MSAAALCCLPKLDEARVGESCPLHRAAGETCSMSQCPMHHGAPDIPNEAHAHQAHGSSHQQHDATPEPSDGCQLTCSDEDLTPAIVLGQTGLLQATSVFSPPDQMTVRHPPPPVAPPERPIPVSVPPPGICTPPGP